MLIQIQFQHDLLATVHTAIHTHKTKNLHTGGREVLKWQLCAKIILRTSDKRLSCRSENKSLVSLPLGGINTNSTVTVALLQLFACTPSVQSLLSTEPKELCERVFFATQYKPRVFQ